jgi:hypothetical protein
MANTQKLYRPGAVGFIDWLGLGPELPPRLVRFNCGFLGRDEQLAMRIPDGLKQGIGSLKWQHVQCHLSRQDARQL